ncbi:hypothetical protein [Microbacterium aerolatum]
MKVRELIEKLQQYPPDAEICAGGNRESGGYIAVEVDGEDVYPYEWSSD